MKKSFIALITSITLGFASFGLMATNAATDTPTTSAHTQSTQAEPFQQAREKLNNMTPEQRQAFMKEARTKWENLSPEEKLKFKVQMREKMHMMKKRQAERKMVKIYSLYLLEQQQQ